MSLRYLQILNGLRSTAFVNPVFGALVNTAANIVQAIALNKQARDDLHSISARLAEAMTVLVPTLSRPELIADPSLSNSLSGTLRAIERLSHVVQKELSRGKIQSFLSAMSNKLAIKQALEDFELALEGVNLVLTLSNLRITERVQNTRTAALREEIEIVQREHLEAIREEVEKHVKERREFSEHVLPPPSGIFHGRGQELDHALSVLSRPEQVSLAILGSGGIGKTTLALSLMHHQSVIERYQHRRYFIACDAIQTPEALSERLAKTLGLNEKRPLVDLKRLVSEQKSPVLITFDNFETPWEPQENRSRVESFLSELTLIPNISVIVTLRGAERPAGVAWTKPFLPPLQPLDLQSAIEIFTSISDYDEDDPYMVQLILALDNIPLAITLIATQAQYTSCEKLLESWNNQKTKIVSRGVDGRLFNLDVSIRVSLESSRFKQEPSAERLLQLLSVLPDGASDALLNSLTEEKFPLDLAIAALLRVSLASRDVYGNLRALSPVREYVLTHLPISSSDLSVAALYLLDVGERYRGLHGKIEAEEITVYWAPQFGNLQSIISQCLSRPQEISPSISTELVMRTEMLLQLSVAQAPRRRLTSWATQVARENQLSVQEARLALNSHETPNEIIEQSLRVLREHGDLDFLSRGLVAAASIKFYIISDDDAARELLEEARLLDRTAMSTATRLQSDVDSARLFMMLNRDLKASHMLAETAAIAEAGSFVRRLTEIHLCLGGYERKRGFLAKSRYHGQTVLLQEQQPNYWMARGLFSIVMPLTLQGQLEDAEKAGILACQIFRQLDMVADWAASVQNNLTQVYLAQDRILEAENSHLQYQQTAGFPAAYKLRSSIVFNLGADFLDKAKEDADRLPALEKGQNRFFLLGELLLRQGSAGEAFSHFVYTLALIHKKGPYRLPLSMLLLRFGDVFRLAENDIKTAQSCYEASHSFIGFLGAPRHEADVIARIALCMESSGDLASASAKLSRAARLFERARYRPGVDYCMQRLSALQSGPEAQSETGSSLPPPTLIGWNDLIE